MTGPQSPLLLDTCAVIWIGNGDPLADGALAALNAAYRAGAPIYISPFTAWEIATLVVRNRISLAVPLDRFIAEIFDNDGVVEAPCSTAILVESTRLPGTPPNDPADRIIIATARELGARLVTRDRKILDYAAGGQLMALTC